MSISNENILALIENKKNVFTKGQKKIAEYILENYEKTVYITAAELAKQTEVSESTVVRFATMLGFDGYPELQQSIKKLAMENLEASKRLEVSGNRFSKKNKHILKLVMQSDSDNINTSLTDMDENVFDEVVDEIIRAKKVYVVGARSSAYLASFLCFHLNLMLDDIVDIGTGSEVFERIFKITKDDVFICFSFPRYSQRTIKAIEFAKSKNAITIAITDNLKSPVTKFATHILNVKCEMVSVVDSLTAPMSLINAIVVAISVKKKDEIIENYDLLEKLWKEEKVYSSERP